MVAVHSFLGGRAYAAEIRPESGIRVVRHEATTEITFTDSSDSPLTLVFLTRDAGRLLGYLRQAGVVEPAVLELPTPARGDLR